MNDDLTILKVPVSELTAKELEPEPCESRAVVLVVDDERVIADSLVAILDHAGYAAMAAYTGEEALEIARDVPPQVLISDIVMPGIDGFELAKEVRSFIPDCRVVLFSGQATTVSFGNGPRFPLLAKPVHPARLLTEIQHLLAGA